MAVVLYSRSEPRQNEWMPLLSQQIRLRNIKQVYLLNPSQDSLEEGSSALYFTLHVTPLSAPFFTSEKFTHAAAKVVCWKEIRTCSTRLSLPGCVIRLWNANGRLIRSWGVYFQGLHYLGYREDWSPSDFLQNTFIFCTPYGSFTSLDCHLTHSISPERFLQIRVPRDNIRSSYSLKNLVALHGIQRSLLEESDLAAKLRADIGTNGYVVNVNQKDTAVLPKRLVERANLGRRKLRLKEDIDELRMKLNCLLQEKGRAEGRVRRLKKESANLEELTSETVNRMVNFSRDRISVKESNEAVKFKRQELNRLRGKVFQRKKELISELLVIYPLALVEGSKRYSINGVQLPNAEEYGSETAGQISVALGYTAHLVALISFFMDIPMRYPIRHFGSRSRIIDHITVQIPDKEREFPLFFKGRKDLYSAYAVYLLNKNIAQLRWHRALSTPDLRATLPNLYELLTQRLIIPGWPPCLVETCELAQEITEDIETEFFESDTTRSLDQGLDHILGSTRELEDSSEGGDIADNPGGNYAALGDIQHGRGQDRFLSGWKKTIYSETDDFDPKWLLDSMNLDFDTGRRFSWSRDSPTPPMRPIVAANQLNSRRRRVGQVEAPTFGDFEKNTVAPKKTLDISQLELNINEFERRKSRNKNPASSSPLPTFSVPTPVLPGPSSSRDLCMDQSYVLIYPAKENDEWTENLKCLNEQKTFSEQHHHDYKDTELCNVDNHIPPPFQMTVVLEDEKYPSPFHQVTDVVNEAEVPEASDISVTEVVGNNNCVDENSIVPLQCDISEDFKNISDANQDDASLWLRTEALLGSQSFNLVRRRMSMSESTN